MTLGFRKKNPSYLIKQLLFIVWFPATPEACLTTYWHCAEQDSKESEKQSTTYKTRPNQLQLKSPESFFSQAYESYNLKPIDRIFKDWQGRLWRKKTCKNGQINNNIIKIEIWWNFQIFIFAILVCYSFCFHWKAKLWKIVIIKLRFE